MKQRLTRRGVDVKERCLWGVRKKVIVEEESGKRGEGVIVCGVFIELRSDMGFVMALEHWRLLIKGKLEREPEMFET